MFVTNVLNPMTYEGLGEHVYQLVDGIDKIGCVYSKEHLFSKKVIINICVWFFHGRLGLMYCKL